MRKQIAVLTLAVVFIATGCARFKTTQTDKRTDADGSVTEITTVVRATTFFDSKSGLADFKATQSEKQQGATVGSLNQESSGSNAVQILKIVVEGAAKAVVP